MTPEESGAVGKGAPRNNALLAAGVVMGPSVTAPSNRVRIACMRVVGQPISTR